MISLSAIRVSSVAALALSFIVTCRPNIFPAPRLVAVNFRRSGFDSRGAEKGVSQTRFTRKLRRQTLYVKCRIYLAQSCKAAAPVVNVVVFIEKQDHPLSQVRRLAIDKAFEFIAQIRRSEAKAHGL
jgi:hypothetical protein